MVVQVVNTLGFLLGRWSIERTISDHHDGVEIRFSGVAVVAPCDGGATYQEQGQISRGAHTGPARRRLRFTENADGTLQVDFQDGRPFVDLDLAGGTHSAIHPCRADLYEMGFDVLDPDQIRERWRVTGPAKDYVAETIWRRL